MRAAIARVACQPVFVRTICPDYFSKPFGQNYTISVARPTCELLLHSCKKFSRF